MDHSRNSHNRGNYEFYMSNNDRKVNRKSFLTAKLLVYDWGWADEIIYKLKAKTTEKLKGVVMVEKIKEIFGINESDLHKHQEKEIEMQRQIQTPVEWTRDEKGNIVSPFKKKEE